MPVPDFTPYGGLLPSEADPATFPARAEALMGWFTQTGAPQLAALAAFLDGIMEDEATVLNALEALEASLGGLALVDILDEAGLASNSQTRPPSQRSVRSHVRARDITDPHLIVSTSNSGNTSLSAGSEYDVPFNDVLHQDVDIVPGIQLFSGDLVYVPAGTYYAEWESAFFRNSGSNTGRFLTTLRDKTAGVDLGYGARGACSAYEHGSGHGRARFTLAAMSTVGLVVDITGYNLELEATDSNFARPARNRFLRLWKLS